MPQFIEGSWTIMALRESALADARKDGTVLTIEVNDNPERRIPTPNTILFLRVTDVGLGSDLDFQARVFRGYVSDDCVEFQERTLDALDHERVQFVEGMVYSRTDQGTIRPCREPMGDNAPGAEPWLVLALPGQHHIEPVTTVMARSEAEATRRAKLTRISGRPGTYRGHVAGDTYICTLRRLASCPSF